MLFGEKCEKQNKKTNIIKCKRRKKEENKNQSEKYKIEQR
jgi:hypothetical protein